jgi:hypothetical protein
MAVYAPVGEASVDRVMTQLTAKVNNAVKYFGSLRTSFVTNLS